MKEARLRALTHNYTLYLSKSDQNRNERSPYKDIGIWINKFYPLADISLCKNETDKFGLG